MKSALIISQSESDIRLSNYINAFDGGNIDIITGSEIQVNGNIIYSARYDKSSLFTRIKSWLAHYFFVKRWVRNHKNNKYDIIIMTSNPSINSFLVRYLKKIYKSKMFLICYDIYPQAIRIHTRNPILKMSCIIWDFLNNRNYPLMDSIVTVGTVMAQTIKNDLKRDCNIKVIPESVDVELLKPVSKKDNPFAIQNQLVDKFIVLYSGNMGNGQNFDIILKSAALLESYKDILFVFIGKGTNVGQIEDYIKNGGKNVKIFPYQNQKNFQYSLAIGDIGIVTQKNISGNIYMPLKTYGYMACGAAILGICPNNSDLYNLVVDKGIGEVCTQLSEQVLCNIILDLYNNSEKTEHYKISARKSAVQYFGTDIISKQYRELFEDHISK